MELKKIRRFIIYIVIIFSSAIFISTAAGITYFYYQASQILPQDTSPSTSKHPQAALDLLLLEGGKGISPAAARILMHRNNDEKYSYIEKNWLISFLTAGIWVRLNWSQEEILNTILDEHIFVWKWKGIESASHKYFGVDVSSLRIEEIAVLIANFKSNSRYNPWCNREIVEEKASKLLEKYIKDKPISYSQNMFERLQQQEFKCNN